ncbi:hypothetical protein GGP88_003026 [Salinibacter ruber]|nr:hypothetical protein [Salinibacter ruber]MCS3785452.1 hypothetical protein [Salinibacter ruber]
MLYARQAPFRELLQEGLPSLLRLAGRHAQAENLPLALCIDADRQKDRSRPDSTLSSDFDVHGVEKKKGIFAFKGPLVPGLDLLVEFLCKPRDCRLRELSAT